MKHYGDITKISGYDVPIVDVITGGSPCQDLSVAGKRAGLDGDRSGLFMEQIRIVKEMREHDRTVKGSNINIRPRYMVWENVPGAFSSNQGKDFQAVLTEIVRIAEPDAPVVPMPEKRWTKSGCLYDDMGGWSVAWRVHDAQFWGVPQRRKRISLVADFAGLSAAEILFERKGLSGDLESCGKAGQETAGAAGGGADGAIFYDAYQHHGWRRSETSGTLTVGQNNTVRGDTPLITAYGIDQQGGKGGANYTEDVCPPILSDSHGTPHAVAYGISSYDSNAMKSPNPHSGIYEADTARTLDLNGGSPACNQGGIAVVQSVGCDHQNRVTDYTALCVGNGQLNQMSMAEQANTLDTMHDQQAILTTVGALCARDYKGVGNQYVAEGKVIPQNAIVRRLTPLECERLQGYPDGWTNIGEWVDSKGKKHKDADSPRYKALGNSIALPFWQWMARRICAQYERPVTMASLFDGIGGFPLVFERSGAKAVWASEIEEFPIAVTKKHFPME